SRVGGAQRGDRGRRPRLRWPRGPPSDLGDGPTTPAPPTGPRLPCRPPGRRRALDDGTAPAAPSRGHRGIGPPGPVGHPGRARPAALVTGPARTRPRRGLLGFRDGHVREPVPDPPLRA